MTDQTTTPPASPAPPSAPAPTPTPAAPPAPSVPAAPAASPASPAATAAPRDHRYQWFSSLAFASVALVGVLVILYAWHLPPFVTAIVKTENALVRGQVTLIGTQLSGYVVGVKVQDFQMVKQGELLVQIDDRIYRQHLYQAHAQLASQKAALANSLQQRRSAEASITQAQAALVNTRAQAEKTAADLSRIDRLVGDGSLSVREQDQSKAARAAAVASVAQGLANLEIARQNLQSVIVNRDALVAAVANAESLVKAAQIDMDNTRVTAPSDGQLGQVTVRQGAYVNAGAQLMGLVPAQMWVIANYKETQMNGVRVGQRASFHVDALDGAVLTGQVEHISPATGSEFAALPADNATGNYVKIAQRIPVRIRIDASQPLAGRLRPGMSVVVSVDTASDAADADHRARNAPLAQGQP